MADPVDASEVAGAAVVARSARHNRRRDIVRDLLRRRLRVQLVPLGVDADPPTESTTTEAHVLQKDFLNIVGSSSGVEIKVVRDSDGGMRFYVESIPASAITLDDSGWSTFLAGSGVLTVQDLADWLDDNN